MDKKLLIETIGTITKEETVASVDYQIIPGTLVLETLEPFPGYHHADPEDNNPKSVFLVIKSFKGREEISRMSQNIQKYFNNDLDAASSRIIIYNKTYFAIRLRGLESYNIIHEIQKCFQNEGISFLKSKKIKEKAIIRVKKYFSISPSEDENIYIDNIDSFMSYLGIPELLSWKMFEKITYNIKNNWDFEDFDAALGTLYIHGGVKDIIRIFGNNIDGKRLRKIHSMYLNEMKKII